MRQQQSPAGKAADCCCQVQGRAVQSKAGGEQACLILRCCVESYSAKPVTLLVTSSSSTFTLGSEK